MRRHNYTLADSSRAVVECVTHALGTAGLPVPAREEILATIGLPLPAIFERLAPGTPPDRLVRLFVGKADEVVERLTRVYDDTVLTVETLAARGCRLGIASTKFRYRIEAILRARGCWTGSRPLSAATT
ncbi:MAG: HAD hydrolase-like protein [bacterium]|nr:HAD hydrolase-like protein [bacterium]